MKETAPVLDSTEPAEPPTPEDGQTTVLEAIQASPLGPLLDVPLPELALPELPPLPTLDELMKPITDLAAGFGTGVLGSFDPTMLLQQASGLIDAAMELGMGGLKVLDQIWQSDAATNAQTTGRAAQSSGEEVVARGNDISAVTQDAAAVVQRGNAELVAIAESFVATAVATAPLVLTPPGQFALITSATEHLTQALAVVAETRAELTGRTAQMSTLSEPVPVPAGPTAENSGMSPFAIASSVIENIGKPLVTTVTDTISTLVETHAASVAPTETATDAGIRPASTTASSYSPASTTTPGFAPTATLPQESSTQRPNVQNVVAPGIQPGPQQPNSVVSSRVTAATVSAALGTSTGMGMVPPMMAARPGESEVDRPTPSYLVTPVNRTDVVGDLGAVVSPVLGVSDDPRNPDHYA